MPTDGGISNTDWQTCHALGGPFAAFLWNGGDDTKSSNRGAIVFAVTLVMIIIQVPIAAWLYFLAHLCNRRDANLAARRRACWISTAIDKQLMKTAKLDALCARRAALASRTGSRSSESTNDSRRTSTMSEGEKIVQARIASHDEDIKILRTEVDELNQRLTVLPMQRTRTERLVGLLTPGDAARQVKYRIMVFSGMTILAIIMIPSTVLVPFALQSRAHCETQSRPNVHSTSGLWLAYAMLCVVPALISWSQVLRTFYHWRRPDLCTVEESMVQETASEELNAVQNMRANGWTKGFEEDGLTAIRTWASLSRTSTIAGLPDIAEEDSALDVAQQDRASQASDGQLQDEGSPV